MGALKLGFAAFVGYTFGAPLGDKVLTTVSQTASVDAHTGAQWGGRIAVFLVAAAILSKV